MTDPRTWGVPALQPYLADPKVEELFVGPHGRVEARGAGGSIFAVEPNLLTRGAVMRLAAELVRALGVSTRQGTVRGVVHGFGVAVLFGPDVDPAPAICFTRRAAEAVDVSQLVTEGTLEPRVSIVLERAAAAGVSLIAVGPRRSVRARLASAVIKASTPGRRVGALYASGDPATLTVGNARAAGELGVDLLLAREPEAQAWAELLISGVPFVAELTAPDLEAGLDRLTAFLLLARPDLGRLGASMLVASAVDLFVEIGLVSGRDVALTVAEADMLPDGLMLRRLAARSADGSTALSLSGSKVERRIERLSFLPRASAPPSVPPQIAASRAAISGRGGLARVSTGEFEIPDRRVVGRVSADQLSELTPDQLVSQSFLVDVGDGGFDSEVRLNTEDVEEDAPDGRVSEPAPIPDPVDDRPSFPAPPPTLAPRPPTPEPPPVPPPARPTGSKIGAEPTRALGSSPRIPIALSDPGTRARRPPIERLATEVGSGPSHGLVAADPNLGEDLDDGFPGTRQSLSTEFGVDETMELGAMQRQDVMSGFDEEEPDKGGRTAAGLLAQMLTGEEAPLSPITADDQNYATQLVDETVTDPEDREEPATAGASPSDSGSRRTGDANKSGLRRRAR